MLRLPDAWVWDSWYLDVDGVWHAFYLKASRALIDPDRRHQRASIGHAVSSNLVDWTELPDALVHGDGPAFDDLATWTGSVVRADDGTFHLFYTGISREFGDRVQRIGQAVSDDLTTWTRVDASPVCADARWYETRTVRDHEPWRDPWVIRDEAAGSWRMLVTASSASDAYPFAGCIGTATSADLLHWEVGPPLAAGMDYGQLEVPQVVEVEGSWVLVWCMHAANFGRRDACGDDGPPITGTWTAPAMSPTGPFDFARAEPIRLVGMYAGRVLVSASTGPLLLAFADCAPDGSFGGYLTDPVALRLTQRGTLQPVE